MNKRDDVERDIAPGEVINNDHMIGDTPNATETQDSEVEFTGGKNNG